MELGLDGTVAVVTGGASTIGRAIAMALAAEGAVVAIFDRDGALADKTTAQIHSGGGVATFHQVDLTDLDSTEAAVGIVEDEIGPIRTLVNNVGWNGKAAAFLDLPPERWAELHTRNIATTANATRAVLRRMVERREGSIVSIASDAGFGAPGASAYGATKAGVMSFMRSIASEYGPFGVRANTVSMGLVIPETGDLGEHGGWRYDTGLNEEAVETIKATTPLRLLAEANDIASAVAFLASHQARRLTGQILSVSGGYCMPR